jgi:hypothetical protein
MTDDAAYILFEVNDVGFGFPEETLKLIYDGIDDL